MTASTTRPVTRAHLSILVAFWEAGGAGDLDMYGRVVVGPTCHIVQGDPASWLLLVAHGLVSGEFGRMIVTEEGRSVASRIIAGRTREAV